MNIQGRANNVIKISDELCNSLQMFYNEKGQALDTNNLTLEIEREFGGRIVKEICEPYFLDNGECLLIALAIAKNKEVVWH